MAIRFLGELAEVRPDAWIEGDRNLSQFRGELELVKLADGQPLGRGRAQTLVERLLVGALDDFGIRYMRAMGQHLDAIVRLRRELAERFQAVLGHFEAGRDPSQLPASLLDTTDLERLFNELDAHLDAIDQNTGRHSLEHDRYLADNPDSRSGDPHDALDVALHGDTAEPTEAQRLEQMIEAHGVAETLAQSGHSVAEVEAIVGPESPQSQSLLDYQVDEAFARLERGEGEWQARRDALERRRHGKSSPGENVIDIGRGVMRALVKKVRNVFGRRIDQAPKAVGDAWARAVARVTDQSDPLHVYDLAQGYFWDEVRADPAAQAWFTDNGFRFEGTRAPEVAVPVAPTTTTGRQEINVSLDHIRPKATNPSLALDPANLRFVSGWDNWLLARLEDRLRQIDSDTGISPQP